MNYENQEYIKHLLFTVIIEKNDNMVRYLLSLFSDNELIQANQIYSYVQNACVIGNTDYVNLLLSRGCKINFNNNFDGGRIIVNELFLAINNGNHHILKYFLDNMLIPKELVSDVTMSIISSTFNTDLDFYKYIIKKYIDITDIKFLMLVCRFGHLDILKYLIKLGADINYCLESNDSKLFPHNAFSDAICSENIDVVKVVIDAGVDLKKWYYTAYHYCLIGGPIDIVDYLDNNYPEYTNLISNEDRFAMACLRGDIDSVKTLFKIVRKNKHARERGLFLAQQNKQQHITTFLVKIIPINSREQFNDIMIKFTNIHPVPSHWFKGNSRSILGSVVAGCISNNFDLCRSVLIKEINEKDGIECLHFLLTSCSVNIVKNVIGIFTEKKIKITDKKIVHGAIFKSNYVILDYLTTVAPIDKGSLRNINVSAPLKKVQRMISYLVDKGADVNYVYTDGSTIIEHLLMRCDYQHIFDTYAKIAEPKSCDPDYMYEIYYKRTDEKIMSIVAHFVKLGYEFRNLKLYTRSLMYATKYKLFATCRYIIQRCYNLAMTQTIKSDYELNLMQISGNPTEQIEFLKSLS